MIVEAEERGLHFILTRLDSAKRHATLGARIDAKRQADQAMAVEEIRKGATT